MDLSSIIKYPVNVVMYFMNIYIYINTHPGMCIIVVELFVNILLLYLIPP